MQKGREMFIRAGLSALSVLTALGLSALLILMIQRDPVEVFTVLWNGAFSTPQRFARVLNFWIPLTFAALGLVFTFRAGLWNIGVEGQIMFGAVFATGVALFVPAPAWLLVPLSLVSAIVGGILWALLVGFLKIQLGVHEIFGGVALNAFANIITTYLTSNVWSAPGTNAAETRPFDAAARLPNFSSDLPVNVPMLVLAIFMVIVVLVALNGTRWGLQLKATGNNARSALLLGVPTQRVSLGAFAICGGLAGLAGAYRVLHTFGKLEPLVSGEIGFLAILVVLLVGNLTWMIPVVTLVFAGLLVGSTALRVRVGLDASLAEVLQGFLVLFVILGNGLQQRFLGRTPKAPPPTATETTAAPLEVK